MTRVDIGDFIDWKSTNKKDKKSFCESAKSFLRRKGIMPKVGKIEID